MGVYAARVFGRAGEGGRSGWSVFQYRKHRMNTRQYALIVAYNLNCVFSVKQGGSWMIKQGEPSNNDRVFLGKI